MIRRTKPRKGDDKPYRDWIRSLPCVVCVLMSAVRPLKSGVLEVRLFYWEQVPNYHGPTEVCHVGVRGIGQKCPDREAIPLCTGHHRPWQQGGKDDSQHTLGKAFWQHHGLDRAALIAELNAMYDAKA